MQIIPKLYANHFTEIKIKTIASRQDGIRGKIHTLPEITKKKPAKYKERGFSSHCLKQCKPNYISSTKDTFYTKDMNSLKVK